MLLLKISSIASILLSGWRRWRSFHTQLGICLAVLCCWVHMRRFNLGLCYRYCSTCDEKCAEWCTEYFLYHQLFKDRDRNRIVQNRLILQSLIICQLPKSATSKSIRLILIIHIHNMLLAEWEFQCTLRYFCSAIENISTSRRKCWIWMAASPSWGGWNLWAPTRWGSCWWGWLLWFFSLWDCCWGLWGGCFGIRCIRCWGEHLVRIHYCYYYNS